MKRLMTTTIVALSLLTSAHADPFKERAQQIHTLYNQGVLEMHTGKTEAARTTFKKVLKLQPGHGPAKYQLARVDLAGKDFRLKQRKAKFKTTILKEVDLHEVTLSEALDALNLMSSEATEKKWSPNLMIQDPKGKIKDKEITLKMTNIPVAAALHYILEMAGGGMLRYDEHATVVHPK